MDGAIATVVEQNSLPAHQSQSSATLAMIERLVVDPNADIEKLERLLAMQDKVLARQAEAEFNADLAAMQASMPCVGERGGIKNNKGDITSTYALWEDVVRELLPHISRHGFALSFRIVTEGNITVTAVLSHRAGHKTETSITLPVDATGSKNGVQAVASSVSYGQRYTARALLNFATHNDPHDDDGQGAVAEPVGDFITPAQVADLKLLITKAGADEAKFLAFLKAPTLGQIRPADLARGVALLNQKIAAKAKKESAQ